MRLLVLLLLILLIALQHRLWLGQHSVMEYWAHQTQLGNVEQQNAQLVKRNQLLRADVTDLQIGMDAIEERARNELGLIKQNEVFFRIVTPMEIK
ncbi:MULTISPECIES: cell division protein FtsB [Rheinheimera]|uniref:Cell division protein FtsB n=1 Tax=Rheinheimera marina TaxID=1774958 RepID=A0ABV9JNB8_9GAMM